MMLKDRTSAISFFTFIVKLILHLLESRWKQIPSCPVQDNVASHYPTVLGTGETAPLVLRPALSPSLQEIQ